MTTMEIEANRVIFANLHKSLRDDATFGLVLKDFTTTFLRLGCQSEEKARSISLYIVTEILRARTLTDAEKRIKHFFENTKLKGSKTVFNLIAGGLQGRIEIIFHQLKPYLEGVKGNVLDFGCGDARISQMFYKKLSLAIEGVDVRNFKAKNVTVPVKMFSGGKVPVDDKYYECAILTNVIHHEKDNEKVLKELSRVVKNKLVIIETVPEATTTLQAKKDWGRVFCNDVLWNRFFNYANIPVPGTYEIPTSWTRRFKKYGWKVSVSKDLGIDQPTVQARHHLLILER